jgi:4-amino-4-deoxy-L-arabinose transferase-like glycosyltransferase
VCHPGKLPSDPSTGAGKHRFPGTRPPWHYVILLAGLSTAIAGGQAVALRSRLVFLDEPDYVSLAHNLSSLHLYSSDGVHPTAYRSPGYPLLMSAVALVSESPTAYRLMNASLLGATVVLVYLLGRLLVSPGVALIAAGVFALNPLAVYTAAFIYPQTLAGVLLCGALLVALPVGLRGDHRSRLRPALAGLLFGVLAVTTPPVAAAGLVTAAWLARRARLLTGIMVIAVMAVPVAIWTARNFATLEAVIPVSTNTGGNLLLGNSDGTQPDSGTLSDISAYTDRVRQSTANEAERDRLYREEAVAWVRGHPTEALRLFGQKLVHHFSVSEPMRSQGGTNSYQVLLLAVSFLPVLALALLRLVPTATGRLHPGEGLLAASYAAVTFTIAVAVTRLRYRVPLEPLLALLAASSASALWARWRDRHPLPTAQTALVDRAQRADIPESVLPFGSPREEGGAPKPPPS